MEESATAPCRTWSDTVLLTLLLLAGAGIHGWIVAHTEVAARDSIGFIRYALALQNRPWAEVLQHAEQHPVYPLALLAVSLPVRQFLGTTCESLVLSAQVTAPCSARCWCCRCFTWAGSCLTGVSASGRPCCFRCCRLLHGSPRMPFRTPFSICWSRRPCCWRPAPPQTVAGRACPVRIGRGPGVPDSAGRRPGCPGRPAGAAGNAGNTGIALALAPGGRRRPGVDLGVLDRGRAVHGRHRQLQPEADPRKFLKFSAETDTLPPPPEQGRIGGGPLLAIWWNGGVKHSPHPPLRWGLWALGREVVRASQSFLWLPILLGLWRFRKRLVATPGMMVILILAGIYALILVRMAVEVGYLSERHTIFLMLCGMFWAAAELVALADRLPPLLEKLGRPLAERWQPMVAVACLSAVVIAFLSEAAHPLHANRAGHRAAGLWLRDHYRPGDEILDPFCWAHYYAGAVFAEGIEPASGVPARTLHGAGELHQPAFPPAVDGHCPRSCQAGGPGLSVDARTQSAKGAGRGGHRLRHIAAATVSRTRKRRTAKKCR